MTLQWSPPLRGRNPTCLNTPGWPPQMNDMLSGGPALSGRSAPEQMGETNDPIEISDGEDKAVLATIMASAMATDRAAEREVADAKVNVLPAPCPTLRPR